MLKEFREFAMRGNVVDMAVGLIIGAAFGAIVTSLVTDVIMPPIGMVLGGADFSQLYVLLKDGTPSGPYATLAAAKAAKAVTINIGVFINTIVSFLIVAFAVFMVVKSVNAAHRAPAKAPAAPPEPTPQEKLLAEIRDLLRKR